MNLHVVSRALNLCFDLQEVCIKEKFRLVHPRHLWYHYEANLAKSFTLGFSLNEVSQLGLSTQKSPLHGIAKD